MHLAALISYDRKSCVGPARRNGRLVVWAVEGVISDVQRQWRIEFIIADCWLRFLTFRSKEVEETDLVPEQSSYLAIDWISFWATGIAIETAALCKANERSNVDCMRPRDLCTALGDL